MTAPDAQAPIYFTQEEIMSRVFVYDNREFPDPDPTLTDGQVKASLAAFFGEVATAEVKETQRGEDTVFEFIRRVGVKGA